MRFKNLLLASLLACALSVLMAAGLSTVATAQIPGQEGCPQGQFGSPPDCRGFPGADTGTGCPQGQFGTPPDCRGLPAQGTGCPSGEFGTPPDCAPLPAGCPAGQVGTPPDCSTPPATCPAGQTGTPPNCTTPPAATCAAGQTGTPPNCTTPAASCAAGLTGTPPNCRAPAPAATCAAEQTGTPPNCKAAAPLTTLSGSTGQPASARIIRRTFDFGRGCTPSLLSVSGAGVKVVFAKRQTPLQCRVTMRVAAGATGTRSLRVRRGKRTISLARLIRL